jgi:hypothetical protein
MTRLALTWPSTSAWAKRTAAAALPSKDRLGAPRQFGLRQPRHAPLYGVRRDAILALRSLGSDESDPLAVRGVSAPRARWFATPRKPARSWGELAKAWNKLGMLARQGSPIGN